MILHNRAEVESSDDDEFFKKRDTPTDVTEDFSSFVNSVPDEEKRKHVSHYLSEVPEDEKERFLHDYVVNMKWKDDDDNETPSYEQIVGDVKENTELEEDIKDIDQQDRYEHLYNTRFEQDNLVSYPRWVR